MISIIRSINRIGLFAFLLFIFDVADVVANKKDQRMVLTRSGPDYVRNENYPEKWFRVLREGIDMTRAYLGNYGPLCVYIIGQEKDELKSTDVAKNVINAYCRNRHGEAKDRVSDCLKHNGASLIKRARDGSTEAYLSYVDFLDKPLAELVFINPHGFPMPYLHTRGIHEYAHVFQRAFASTPTWLTEGGAEFLAFHLGDKHDWIDFKKSMKDSMRMAKKVKKGEASLIDFEDVEKIEKERPHLRKYYRHLAYDAGAWAVALIIHRSEGRSVKRFMMKFYPMLDENGWRSAVCRYGGYEDIDEFYEAFAELQEKPVKEQMKLLHTIKP
ncbi:MAG: hypothetical protein QF600_00445 [Verrucomicrobiota bacterium]|nr:hypothetical protein [Verrucomicrobiota bacterium]